MRGLLVLLLTFSARMCPAQDFLQFHYDASNGLADNRVQSIVQDRRGFMWFGTAEGLSRFDGINFKNYFTKRDSTSLPSNSILHLLETKPGHLAVIAESRLEIMNTYTGQFYRPPDFANRLIYNINKISESRYLLSSNDTCFVADQDMKMIDALVPPSDEQHRAVFGSKLDKEMYLVGLIGMYTPSDFYLYDSRIKEFSRLELSIGKAETEYLAFDFFDSARQWLYFNNSLSGIYRYSLHGDKLKSWPLSGFGSGYGPVVKINDSLLWVGGLADGRGAMQLNLHDDKMTRFKINDKERFDSYTMYTDSEGNHWMGTSEGVTKLSPNNQFIKTWETFPGRPSTWYFPLNIIRGKDHKFYLSFFSTPYLYQLDQKNDTWKLFYKNLVTGPWCVNAVGDDIIFTGGNTTRFTTYSPLSDTFHQSSDFLKQYFPNSDVLILAFQHSNGDRWYSGNKGGGFVRVSAKDGSLHHYTKDGPRGHFTMGYYANQVEDKSGDVWFGVNKTPYLLHWNKHADWFTEVHLDTVPGTKGVSLRGINKVLLDKKDNLWIGFEGTGLVKYDYAQNRAVHYNIRDGLASDFVSFMAFDGNDRLWIGTPKGLNCLFINEDKVQTFTKKDGLVDDRFVDGFINYDSASNKIWVGAAVSVMRFDPDALLAATKDEINVYLDELFINGKPQAQEMDGTLHLHYKENSIQFRYVAVNMDGKPIQFSYKLERHETEWVDNLASTTVSYANLEPGNYSFTVRANYQGDTNRFFYSKPFALVVATPWFKTWWFRLAAVAGSMLSIVLLIRSYYAGKNEKQRLILEKQQAIEKERTRIATDMHDDFGASLSRIKFISEKIKLKAEDGTQLIHDLTKISDYSDQMTDKMSEIVWALNERYDSLDDLVSFSRAYAADYLQHHAIRLNFVSDTSANQMVKGDVRRNVFLVIKESLHNIVKHAAASEVEINFQRMNQLKVIVHDNGKGFDQENIRPFANGVSNMKKRMDDIGGNLEIMNEQGTTIILTVSI